MGDAKLKIVAPGAGPAGPKLGAPAKGGIAPRPPAGGLTPSAGVQIKPNFSPPPNPPTGAALGMRPQMGGLTPAAGAKTGTCAPNCKWCKMGECWTSGQISKGKGTAG